VTTAIIPIKPPADGTADVLALLSKPKELTAALVVYSKAVTDYNVAMAKHSAVLEIADTVQGARTWAENTRNETQKMADKVIKQANERLSRAKTREALTDQRESALIVTIDEHTKDNTAVKAELNAEASRIDRLQRSLEQSERQIQNQRDTITKERAELDVRVARLREAIA